jgi:hypothetical protein
MEGKYKVYGIRIIFTYETRTLLELCVSESVSDTGTTPILILFKFFKTHIDLHTKKEPMLPIPFISCPKQTKKSKPVFVVTVTKHCCS